MKRKEFLKVLGVGTLGILGGATILEFLFEKKPEAIYFNVSSLGSFSNPYYITNLDEKDANYIAYFDDNGEEVPAELVFGKHL